MEVDITQQQNRLTAPTTQQQNRLTAPITAAKDAYQLARMLNPGVGTLAEWLASLVGADGKSAYEVAVDNGFTGDEATWLDSLVGAAGADGADGGGGADGADGKSAYEVAVANDFIGDEAAWLSSLVGATGTQGPAPWTFVGAYDNAADYDIGAAVTYQGGFYYRTGNPINPGYPPTPGAVNESWTPVADRGEQGAAGPNTITTSTTAPSLTGYIFGNGTTIAGATAAVSAATANTLVLRTGTGAASFAGITASGTVTDTQPTDAATPVNAFTAATSTEAVFNAQKWSPVIKQSAKGWGTTASTSQDVSFSTIVKPTQSTVPTGTWSLQSSIAGGALTDQLTVTSSGTVSSAVSFSAPIYYGVNNTGGILRLDGNAATRGLGIGSLNLVAWSSGAYTGGSVSGDTNLNRATTGGILQIGTTAANALGSLACFDGTFGGAINTFSLTVTGGTTFGEESLISFYGVEYDYGTGAASAHRIALGAGTTGATLFGAADAAAARTTLGLATTDSVTFAGITASGGLVVTSASYPVLDVTRSTAATGDFRAATRFKRANSSGTSSSGMGVGCFFEIPNAANALKNVGFFGGAIATATAGAEIGELVFSPAWQGADPYLRRDMVLRATSAAKADLSLSGNLTASGTVTFGAGAAILNSPSAGVFTITDAAGTGFGRLCFGPATSSFSAFRSTGTTIDVVTGNESGFANMQMNNLTISGQLVVSNTPLTSNTNVAGTTGAQNAFTLSTTTNGAAAATFGPRLRFQAESASGTTRDAAAIDAVWTDAADATRTADIVFNTVSSASALTERMRLSSQGNLTASGTITVTGASTLTGGATFGGSTQQAATRIALGAGTTGATLFGAADAGAARTTLGLATTDSPTFAGLTASGAVKVGTATTADATSDVLIATSATTQSGLTIQGKVSQTAPLLRIAGSTNGTANNGWEFTPNDAIVSTSGTRSYFNAFTLIVSPSFVFQFSSSSTNPFTTRTLGFAATSAGSGVLEINNGTLGTLRDLTLRNLTASGNITAATTHPNTVAITATQGIYSSFLGANQSGGGFIACSISGVGVGFAHPTSSSFFPCNASGALTTGVMNLGRADYRFNNYFGTNGNFSGTLAVTGATTLGATTITSAGSFTIGDDATASLNATLSRNGAGALLLNSTNSAGVNIYGKLQFSNDNVADIGNVATHRPRNLYVGTGVFAANITVTGASTLTGGATFGDSTQQAATRIALGAGTTGATLFGAADAGAARTTLGLATADSPTFAEAAISASTASTSKDTGALVIQNGGLGVEGAIYAGGAVNGGVNSSFSGIRTNSGNGLMLSVDGGYSSGVRLQVFSDAKLRIGNISGSSGVYLGFGTSGTLAVRNYADSADGNITAANLTASGTITVTGASTLTGGATFGGSTQQAATRIALGAAEASHTHVVADITDIGSIVGGILVEVTADYTALYGNYLIVALNPARISLPPIEAGQISMTITNKSNGEVVIEGSLGDLVNDSAELILSRRNSSVQLKPTSSVGWVIA